MKSRFALRATVLAALVGSTTAASAADAPAAPAAPSLGSVLESSGITVSGWVDASFLHQSGDGTFVNGAASRVFDNQKDGFALQQAAVNIGYQPKSGFGAFVNLTAGNDAQIIHSYDGSRSSDGSPSPDTSKFDVTQAYLQYAGDGFTIIGGKFVTLAGAEVIASPSNSNFSRSILFGYAIPFAHTGFRATITPTDTVTLYLGLNNGWDQLRDSNTSKTAEVGIGFAPTKTFSINAYGYFGKELVLGPYAGHGSPEGQRSLLDVVATWGITDALTVILNFDWGKQKNGVLDGDGAIIGDAKWTGLAGYVNYTINDTWHVSLRGEYLDDKDGYRTGTVQKWKEVTATLGYAPTKSTELRLEARFDKSDVEAFSKDNGADSAKDVNSIGVQALYKF
jgi:hypothetical protein